MINIVNLVVRYNDNRKITGIELKLKAIPEESENDDKQHLVARVSAAFHASKLFGETGKIDDLMPYILRHKTERYFIPQSDVHNTSFAQILKQKNINFTEGVMYRTVSNEIPKDEPFDYDMLVFFSPSGIQSLLKNFPDYQQGDTRIASFGPSTARSICDAGLRLDLQAPTPQYPSITAALDAYLKEQNNA